VLKRLGELHGNHVQHIGLVATGCEGKITYHSGALKLILRNCIDYSSSYNKKLLSGKFVLSEDFEAISDTRLYEDKQNLYLASACGLLFNSVSTSHLILFHVGNS